MDDNTVLAEILDRHLKEAVMGEARVATLANEVSGIPGFIHRSTVRNWRTGASKSVSDWRKLVSVAAALRLDEADTNKLLASAGCAPLIDLRSAANDDESRFLATWDRVPESSNGPRVYAPSEVDRPTATGGGRRWAFLAGLFGALLIAAVAATIYLPDDDVADNVLLDGGFDGGAEWFTYINDAAAAELVVEDGLMRATVNDRAEKVWHISFSQQELEVREGEFYRVRVRVRGDRPNTVMGDVTRSVDPKLSVGAADLARFEIDVTEEWQEHSWEFEVRETVLRTDGGARVLFELGRSEPGTVWFDDVAVIPITRLT